MKTIKKLMLIPFVVIIMICLIYLIDRTNEVKVEVPGGYIYGNLLKPDHNPGKTLAIIVAGSGPTDRDGNTPLIKGKNDSLKYLAYNLKENNIASFRYDKRTSGKSRESFNEQNVTFDLFVEDLVQCIKYLKETQDFTSIYLVGHSQGSLVSLIAAQKEPVTGVISLAGGARPIDQILYEQFAEQDTEIAQEVRQELEGIKAGRKTGVLRDELKEIFTSENREFIALWMKYDPVLEAAKLKIPLYFIYGTSDIQVKPDEIKYFGNRIESDSFKVITDMNHVLKNSPLDRKENLKRYGDPSYPIHPQLVESIVKFIKKASEDFAD